MSEFERDWYNRYMNNMVTLLTLEKLVAAGKLTREAVDGWVKERRKKYGD